MSFNQDPFAPKAAVAPVKGEAAQPTPEAVTEAPENADTGVKEGTTDEVLEWVGDDKERAQAALDAEEASAQPRKRLTAELRELLK